MSLPISQGQNTKPSELSPDRKTLRSCQHAKRLEESGDYERARAALAAYWQKVGDQPRVEGLQPQIAAEVLLRAGTLSGWIASSMQLEVGQEPAKDLLSKSMRLFQQLGLTEKVAEAESELAYCYWREGDHAEALVWLDEAEKHLGPTSNDLLANIALRKAIVTFSQGSFRQALSLLESQRSLFEKSESHALKGKFHVNLATFLKKIGELDSNEEAADRALIEYAAASYHLELARHRVYRAGIENQLGYLFAAKGRFAQAHEHLDKARRLFVLLKDRVHTAQVDETRAKTYLQEGDNNNAEKAARAAAMTLEKGGHRSLLAEALTSLGTAQARLRRIDAALSSLLKASETAEQANDVELAALAELVILEELFDSLEPDEMVNIYSRADRHLARSKNSEALDRLRDCAFKVIAAKKEVFTTTPVDASPPQNTALRPEDLIRDAQQLNERNLRVNWEGFSLRDAVRRLESALIERALRDSDGSVTRASRLLGLPNHNLVSSRLKTKGKDLTHAKNQSIPRRRSLIKPELKEKKGH